MDREEAIKGLEVVKTYFSGYKPNEEMFDMAIEALKARNESADMIYDYLKKRIGSDITDNPFEFEDWFNRMTWHVQECHRQAWEIEALKTQSKWIPCSERMPNSQDYTIKNSELKGYLIQTEYGNMLVAYYIKKKNGMNIITERWYTTRVGIAGSRVACDVVAWMPLPESYKE